MPSKNIQKPDVKDTFYHVYNRGVNKRTIFKEPNDYRVFFSLLKRYLSSEPQLDRSNREYPNYSKDIEVLAICLMPNHFHLLCYQIEKGAMTKLLRGICTSYTMYFNKKYDRVGHLFQERFKASMISNDAYLLHISRYIHLNPKNAKWEYTSLPYYLGKQKAEWIQPEKILEMFEDTNEYQEFLDDLRGYRESMKEIYNDLADS